MATPGKFQTKSIASATGSSETLAEQNPARRELFIFNISGTDWIINLMGGTAAAGAADCVLLTTGKGVVVNSINKVTGIGTAAAKLTVLER